MYNEDYMRHKEITVLEEMLAVATGYASVSAGRPTSGLPGGVYYSVAKELSADKNIPQPPEVLELGEEPTAFESLLNAATTADERKLMRLIDTVLDEAWRFDTGKALRGELRRLWLLRGLSARRFYAAFHGLAERRQRA